MALKKLTFLIFIISLSILDSCQNKTGQNENYSDINSILMKHENSLRDFVSQTKNEEKKEIVNEIIENNFGLNDKNSTQTVKNLNLYKEYFEGFYKSYDSICSLTLSKVDNLKNATSKNIKQNEIMEVKNRLETAIVLLHSYRTKTMTIISKINNIIQLRTKCKYEFKDKQTIVFFDQSCLDSYNSNLNEIEILAVELNSTREQLMEIKSK